MSEELPDSRVLVGEKVSEDDPEVPILSIPERWKKVEIRGDDGHIYIEQTRPDGSDRIIVPVEGVHEWIQQLYVAKKDAEEGNE